MTALEREFAGCINAADYPRWLALMTDDSLSEVVGPDDVADYFAPTGTPVFGNDDEEDGPFIATVVVRDVRVLGEGRVGAVVEWGVANNPDPEPSTETNFHIYERVEGRWLLDEEIGSF